MSADTSTTPFDARVQSRPNERRSWWSSFFQPETEPVRGWGPENEHSCRLEPPDPVRLLADGDAFSFRIFLVFNWRGYAENREELRGCAEQLLPRARRIVTQRLRPTARAVAPHRASVLETEINKQMEDGWITVRDGDRHFWFAVTARVEPDEAVVEQMRPYWAERIKAECDHELGLQRARFAEELTTRWSGVFDQLARDPRASFAARLSEEDFARVFGEFVGSNRKAVHDLLDMLRGAVRGHGEAGLGPSEYTTAWEQAIKAFQKQYGLRPDDPA